MGDDPVARGTALVTAFVLCSACRRHFRSAEPRCPFCDGVGVDVARPASRLGRPSRAGRLVHRLLLGATVSPALGCGGPTPAPKVDLAHVAPSASVAAPRASASASATPSAEVLPEGPPRRLIPIYGSVEIRILQQIPFAPGSHAIMSAAEPTLEEIAKVLKDNPALRVEVEGHADETERAAEALSGHRAEVVVARLTALGVDPGRLVKRALGATKPVVSNATKEGRAKNRRVSFLVIDQP